jgi:hypothetical protein
MADSEGRSGATRGSGSQGKSEVTKGATGRPGTRLMLDVLLYTLARLLLVGVIVGVILGAAHLLGVREFPIVVAFLFAIVVALPLGMWLFAPLRNRATASMAVIDERRRSDRDQLQARLRGDASPPK